MATFGKVMGKNIVACVLTQSLYTTQSQLNSTSIYGRSCKTPMSIVAKRSPISAIDELLYMKSMLLRRMMGPSIRFRNGSRTTTISAHVQQNRSKSPKM